MKEKDKQDRERLLKRFKGRKPLANNPDSDIIAPPDIREAMSVRDEIADYLISNLDETTWNYGSLADGIIPLLNKMVKMEKVEKCDKCWGIPHTGHVCEKCHGSGELVRDLTLEEAIGVLQGLLIGKLNISYALDENRYIRLLDGSIVRVRVGK